MNKLFVDLKIPPRSGFGRSSLMHRNLVAIVDTIHRLSQLILRTASVSWIGIRKYCMLIDVNTKWIPYSEKRSSVFTSDSSRKKSDDLDDNVITYLVKTVTFLNSWVREMRITLLSVTVIKKLLIRNDFSTRKISSISITRFFNTPWRRLLALAKRGWMTTRYRMTDEQAAVMTSKSCWTYFAFQNCFWFHIAINSKKGERG